MVLLHRRNPVGQDVERHARTGMGGGGEVEGVEGHNLSFRRKMNGYIYTLSNRTEIAWLRM